MRTPQQRPADGFEDRVFGLRFRPLPRNLMELITPPPRSDFRSSKSEAKHLSASLQELDLEPPIADWLWLADQLIHPLLD